MLRINGILFNLSQSINSCFKIKKVLFVTSSIKPGRFSYKVLSRYAKNSATCESFDPHILNTSSRVQYHLQFNAICTPSQAVA